MALSLGWLGLAPKSWNKKASEFFTGTPAEYEQVSNLTPSQMRGQKQLEKATRERGAGGAFGESADFYRDILANDPGALEALYNPELRQFREQIIPDISEQFAGMGSGALSSSGFRNAAVGAGRDLSERLAQMRQNLRFQAASGLSGLGLSSLTPHSQYMQTTPGSEGFLSNVAQGVGSAIPGMIAGGPVGAGAGFLSGFMSGGNKQMGSTSPYGSIGSQGNFNPNLMR